MKAMERRWIESGLPARPAASVAVWWNRLMNADRTSPHLLAIAAAAAFTPGPHNALVASSGCHFRASPHLAACVWASAIGFPVMIFLVGFFLAGLFQSLCRCCARRCDGSGRRSFSGWPGRSAARAGSPGRRQGPAPVHLSWKQPPSSGSTPRAGRWRSPSPAQFIRPEAPLYVFPYPRRRLCLHGSFQRHDLGGSRAGRLPAGSPRTVTCDGSTPPWRRSSRRAWLLLFLDF